MRTAIISASALACLAACGGSGDGVLSVSSQSTAAQALASGQTLKANPKNVSALRFDYAGRTTEKVPGDFALKVNSEGGLTVISNGKEYVFTEEMKYVEDDGAVYGFDNETDTSYLGLYIWSGGELEDVLKIDRKDFFQVWDFTNGAQTEDNYIQERMFAIVGSPTSSSALGSLTSRSYQGYARLIFFSADNFETTRTRTDLQFHDISLNANFEQNTISGSFADAQVRPRVDGQEVPDWQDVAGTIQISNGVIVGNEVTANISADTALLSSANADSLSGTMSGSFFGPSAEQIAGGLSGTLTDADGDQTFFGYVGGGVNYADF